MNNSMHVNHPSSALSFIILVAHKNIAIILLFYIHHYRTFDYWLFRSVCVRVGENIKSLLTPTTILVGVKRNRVKSHASVYQPCSFMYVAWVHVCGLGTGKIKIRLPLKHCLFRADEYSVAHKAANYTKRKNMSLLPSFV